MRKQNDQRKRENHLMKKTVCAVMSAVLMMGFSGLTNSEEIFINDSGEEVITPSSSEDVLWGDSVIPEEEMLILDDAVMEDSDMVLDDLLEDVFPDEDIVLPDDEEVGASDTNAGDNDDISEVAGEKEATAEEEASPHEEGLIIDSAAIIANGECGKEENRVFWKLDGEGVLHIIGEGSMMDWRSPEEVPWYAWAGQIKELDITEGITEIGSYALSACALQPARVG